MSALTNDFWETLPKRTDVELLTRDPNGLVAFNKPAGILSHPNSPDDAARAMLTCHYDQTEQAFHWRTEGGEVRRLWLLNRLDSATSGVILLAADAELAKAVRQQFTRKQIRKVYAALVFGKPFPANQVWKDMLAVTKRGGQIRTATSGNVPASSVCVLLNHRQGAFSISLVKLEPKTGRSHQLRVQCEKRNLPIVGDQTYGDFAMNRAFSRMTGLDRLFLHSHETSFSYEFGGKTHLFKATAKVPAEFMRKY